MRCGTLVVVLFVFVFMFLVGFDGGFDEEFFGWGSVLAEFLCSF